MGSESPLVGNRLVERIISLFPKEKRAGLWATAGILYINYFQLMRRITFGLYGRPRETPPEPVKVEPPIAYHEGARGFAPHPVSQYDQSLSYEQWMVESIHFFRSIGFFQRFNGLDDKQAVERLHQEREQRFREMWDSWRAGMPYQWVATIKGDTGEEEHYHDDPQAFPGSVRFETFAQQRLEELYLPQVPFDRKNDLADLWIAQEEATRVWYADLEAAAGPDGDEYIQALSEWGRISRGVLEPKEINESWAEIGDGQYHLTITFRWNGALRIIEFDTPDEWINLAALAAINNLIQSSGIQLYSYVSFDQGAYIVSLTAEEKLRLEQERSWKFATLA